MSLHRPDTGGGRLHRPRAASERFYQRKTWKKLARSVLAAHPLCSDPFGIHKKGGRVVGSREVDHVQSRRDRPDLELVRSNLQALCKPCHSRKTRQEMLERRELRPPSRPGTV